MKYGIEYYIVDQENNGEWFEMEMLSISSSLEEAQKKYEKLKKDSTVYNLQEPKLLRY